MYRLLDTLSGCGSSQAMPLDRPFKWRIHQQQGERDLSSETDFLDLYRRLKLSPDCGLDEFKQAYRRHVSLLHPDRRAGSYLDVRAAEMLQRLTAQYSAAMEFQRRHGRLPGAAAAPRFVAPEVTAQTSRPLEPSIATRRSHSKLLVLVAVATVSVLLWNVVPLSSSPETASADISANDDTGQPEAAASPVLSLGMSPENVRAIEGDPIVIRDGRWEYGPSWISFDHDEVVDWYSSPLHSLKTTGSHPPNRRP